MDVEDSWKATDFRLSLGVCFFIHGKLSLYLKCSNLLKKMLRSIVGIWHFLR